MPQQSIKKACVMGWPISHSLSPFLHGYWLEKYGIEGSYTAEAVSVPKLKDALQALIDNGYAGCNLTIPHKQEALALMDMHDESALLAGVVNTVVVKNGKLKGFDSDGFGFLENLKFHQPSWRGDKVVIVGTGGAARSIIFSLKTEGVKNFVLVNRTVENAQKLSETFRLDAEVYGWDHRHEALKNATLLINGSSLGMMGQPRLELGLDHLPPEAIVADIVYRPHDTELIAAARARGNAVVGGIGMLIHQGRLGFSKWFGQDPVVTENLYAEMKRLAA